MKTVLIIEDDLNIRKLIRDFLEINKYTVLLAENGKIGAELAKKVLPDLIICDVQMPEMNGFEVKKVLSKDKVTEMIPFIFLTSRTDRKDLRSGMELGADDYLFKPFDLKELSNSIETQLEKRDKLLANYSKEEKSSPKSDYSYDDHILLKVYGSPRFVKLNTIVSIVADEKYTRVNLMAGEKLIISKSLLEWEKILPENKFLRVHRATIINIEFVLKVEKWFNRGYKIKLKNSEEDIIISRRYYSKLKEVFV